jgi:hypothetical protein
MRAQKRTMVRGHIFEELFSNAVGNGLLDRFGSVTVRASHAHVRRFGCWVQAGPSAGKPPKRLRRFHVFVGFRISERRLNME